MFVSLGYFGLFLASFLAATILPFASEFVFSALVFGGGLNLWKCVFWATFGNWLGGLTCYWLGHLGKIEWIEKWFKIKHEKVLTFQEKFQKYGDWFAFLSFLPVIGDIIAVGAGFMRCRFWVSAIVMLLGKFLRYVIWMYLNGLFI